jgi:hypothetical protein
MDRYIGIDAHSESSTVVVMGPSGKRLRQQVVDTQVAVLIEFLKGVAGDKYVCIEEGQLAEWLVEALGPHVKEMAVVQPPEQSELTRRRSRSKRAQRIASVRSYAHVASRNSTRRSTS